MNARRSALITTLAALGLASSACTGAGKPEAAKDAPAAAPAPAPPPPDFCQTVVQKIGECATAEEKPLVDGLKDLMLKDCREQKDRSAAEEQADLECAHKSSCDDYRKCQTELLDKKQAIRIRTEVEAALKTGERLEDAVSSCKYSDIKDKDIVALCDALFKKSIETATRELEGIRDSGGDGLSKCFDLQTTAEKVSPEEKARADALCKEVEAGKRAQEALDEVKKNFAAETYEVPFQCGMAVEDLEKLTSEWARNKLQEVARTCYVDLGKKILPARVGKMLICEYQVEQVYQAVKKLGLQDPELDPWIVKAGRKCAPR